MLRGPFGAKSRRKTAFSVQENSVPNRIYRQNGDRYAKKAGGPAAEDTTMKVLLTTDWWTPAVNGVVRSVELLRRELTAQGHDVRFPRTAIRMKKTV